EDAAGNVAVRLAIGPSPRRLDVPETTPGRGAILHEGSAAVLFAYGPVMLHEALAAAEMLGDRVAVVNMPWLNHVDAAWLEELTDAYDDLFVLEDHAPVGALGDTLRRALSGRPITVF